MPFELPRKSTINLKQARGTAKKKLLKFQISPKDGIPVVGILKNKPKFSLEGQYDRLVNLDEKFAVANKLGGAGTNIQFGLTSSWSKKVYMGGSYLGISLQARIMDRFDKKG